MFSIGFTSLSVFFFLYQLPSSSFCTVFDSISSNIDEVLSLNRSSNVFVFGDFNFNIHLKDCFAYSGRSDRPDELCYSFSISNDFNQMVNSPTRIPDYDSHSPALLDLFLLTLRFVLQWLSIHWEILIMWLSRLPSTFHQIHNGMPCFI